ncbi:hypothetical protein FcAc13_00055 [Frischella sp. Ac13]|uniref:NADH-quinone oxidoreductase subunit L n=1 Tax=Frischella japonica TaxID=2741544 RepID=A0ABR7QUA4_9GAMM|nr:proton-conducting transporter membrane subunit [Frischella japonica]MBC9129705.1 hypothetical protein [Frischella japonica]
MNLLYLTIVIPILSFLLLVCLGRNIGKGNIVVTGISTIGLLCLLMVFICIDYHVNSVPETSLIYTRFLWNWFTINDLTITVALYLDGLSLIFLIIIVFFSLVIYIFAAWYFSSSNDIYPFYAYGNLLIASIFLLILADNLFMLFVGWEGVSISCYLLIGIYYRAMRVSYSAIKWFVMTHIVDVFLLIGIFLIYCGLNTLNIREVLSLANNDLAVDSDIIFGITLMLFIGVMGRLGLFPFHLGCAQFVVAPMPSVALLQSFTTVLSGGYLILRLSSLFAMSSDIFVYMGVIAGINIIFASCISLVQNDIKRLVIYINLSQISYIFLAFMIQNWILSLNFIISYGVTSALLLLSTAILIKACNGERDINKIDCSYRNHPLLYGCFLLSAGSVSALPWIMSSFYTEGDIIWGLITANKMGLGIIALVGILLSTLSILRLIFLVFHHKRKTLPNIKVSYWIYIPLIVLAILATAIFVYLPLPIQGIIPIIDFNNHNQLALQLLLVSITILGILIAYILFYHPNPEIKEIASTPISKVLIRLWGNDWYFDKLILLLLVRPYIYIAQLIQRDPISKWMYFINWGIKKINFQIISLESGRLRWYIMSIVTGSIIILFLLILI